jgi:hypothetical protein
MTTRWVLAALLAAAGCSKPSDSTEAKRTPRPPPAASISIPAALHIDVEVDGAPAAAVDAARLASLKPDFSDDEHRAWRIATLVGPAATRPGAVIAAVGDKGLSLEMHAASAATDPIPVLSLNRRGDVLVGLVAPDDPFPDFHGKGGRLSRPGDPLPRLASPIMLRVYVAATATAPASSAAGNGNGGGGGTGGGADAQATAAPLRVVIAGRPPTSWTAADFAAVPRFTVHADNAARDAWSLRDIAHKLVGPKARVTLAVDGDGTRDRIAPQDWGDTRKTPVLRINRRGMYKIEWVDKDGNMLEDDDVRDVRSLELTPSG